MATVATAMVSKLWRTAGNGPCSGVERLPARQQLLAAAARRNDARADLDQPDVRLDRRAHRLPVHHDLGAAAERPSRWRDDDRRIAVLERHD